MVRTIDTTIEIIDATNEIFRAGIKFVEAIVDNSE